MEKNELYIKHFLYFFTTFFIICINLTKAAIQIKTIKKIYVFISLLKKWQKHLIITTRNVKCQNGKCMIPNFNFSNTKFKIKNVFNVKCLNAEYKDF